MRRRAPLWTVLALGLTAMACGLPGPGTSENPPETTPSETAQSKATTAPAATSTPGDGQLPTDQGLPPEVEAYRVEVSSLSEAQAAALERITDLLADPQFDDDAWVGEVLAEADNLERVYAQATGMGPPPELTTFHETWLDGLADCAEAAGHLRTGAQETDTASLEQFGALVGTCAEKLDESTGLMNAYLAQSEEGPVGEEEETGAAPTTTPAPGEVGTVPGNPAPAGVPFVVEKFTLTVTETVRPANDMIQEGEGPFYEEPDPGNEYMLVRVSVTCTATAGEKCFATLQQFGLLGTGGGEYDAEPFITSLPGLYDGDRIEGGVTLEGWLPFQVPRQEADIVLVFQTLAVGAPPSIYLALPS